jgi:predicted AlkP superfamily pyrophosphatase or phosphodiesterase
MRSCAKWSESRSVAQPRASRRHGEHPARHLAARIGAGALLLAAAAACGGSDQPPPEVPLELRTPKVLLIGIDGVRIDVLAEVPTPNIDRLAATGTFTQRTRTTTPSVSGPSWSSMLTGVWPEKHGVTDNQFAGRHYDSYPGFLTRIEQARPELSTFAVVDWPPLMELEGGSTAVGPEVDRRELLDGYELGWAEADARATALATEELASGNPDAMFVYLGNADETSHQTGSIGEPYREAIATSDRQVGMLVDAVRARPTYARENWLILVSTDHGRTDDGDHGGGSPMEMTTFILTSGPAAAVGTVPGESFIVDVAVTALTHMGIAIDPAWELDGRAVGLR